MLKNYKELKVWQTDTKATFTDPYSSASNRSILT